MNRAQLEHVLRAASQVAGEHEVLVIGSQAILGGLPEDRLPVEATSSIEVDVTFLDDPHDVKSDLVDGAIGELSRFHETFGYYAQGVSVTTATLPRGWRERLVVVHTAGPVPARGLCLDPHDCVLAKLLAGREKDLTFATALISAGLIDPGVLSERLGTLDDAHPVAVDRIEGWLRQIAPG